MARSLLRACPVCDNQLRIKVLRCGQCGTKIEGDFAPAESPLWTLSSQDLAFVELFLRVRGNLREVEKRLRVSYSTARGMLEAVNRRLGFEPDAGAKDAEAADRLAIIERLERGEIDVDQATELLGSDERSEGADDE